MSYWPCTTPGCGNKALFVDGDCRNCGARLCGNHVGRAEYHPCVGLSSKASYELYKLEQRRMYGLILSRLDLPKMIEQAQQLRPGHTCQVLPIDVEEQNLIAGGTNVHFPITFDDGKKWLVGLRKIDHAREPHEVMRMTALSEAATFQALRTGGVNVPEVWVPEMSKDPEALLYYFVDLIEGGPYEPLGEIVPRVPADPTVKLIYNVAKWFLDLEKLQFDSIGSLHPDPLDPGKSIIGPLLECFPQNGISPFFNGPYKTARDHYVNFFDTAMKLILAGSRGPPKSELDDYLIALEGKTLVMGCQELSEGPWYLRHADDHKGDHFIVREDMSISGVIDWDWAYTTSKGDAFTPPIGFSVPDFWRGSNAMSPREMALMDAYARLGRPDLADLVKNSKKYRRLNELTQGPFPPIEEMRHVQRAFNGEPDPDEGEAVGTDEDWRSEMMEKYRDDVGLQVVLARHKARTHKELS